MSLEPTPGYRIPPQGPSPRLPGLPQRRRKKNRRTNIVFIVASFFFRGRTTRGAAGRRSKSRENVSGNKNIRVGDVRAGHSSGMQTRSRRSNNYEHHAKTKQTRKRRWTGAALGERYKTMTHGRPSGSFQWGRENEGDR